MMPSVIPARLQFQCGHAALVTLPRVKGETATQRTARVAREKSDALVRQCDFCAPATAAVAVNGNGHGNGSHIAEPTPVADAFDNLAVVVAASAPEPILAAVEPQPAAVIPEPQPVEDLPLTAVETEMETDAEVLAEAVAEAVAEPVVVVIDETPAPRPARPETVRARRTRKPRVAAPAPPAAVVSQPALERRQRNAVARGQRFLVEYQVVRIVQATDIRDALRQATALGASDVVAITRED